MPRNVSDEAFARYVNQIGAATRDQIEAAKAAQAESAKKGVLLSLGAALVQQGILTAAMRENAEKRLQAQQQGGLQQLGQYKLIKKLGEGGMGAVYLAEDTSLGRKVALKVLPKKFAGDREFLSRFRREAQATSNLNHVNIVSAYAVGEELGFNYYAMEYCDGAALDSILKRDKSLPWEKAVEIVMQVARGLKHAHEHGILHRDIKPGNIIVTPKGVAKILDLGLSKHLGDLQQSFYTQTGVALGTPHYISPEQARADKRIDGRTDIYSLGATFYHLVTGQTPFHGSTEAVIMTKHLNEQLPNPQDLVEDIPDGVAHVVTRMMAKEPADRYRDCKELLDDLELVIDGKEPSSHAIDTTRSSVAMARVARPRRPAGIAHGPRPTAGPVPPLGARQHAPVAPSADGTGHLAHTGAPVGKYVAIGAAVLGALIFVAALNMRGNRDREEREARSAAEKKKADETARLADEKLKAEEARLKAEAARLDEERRKLVDDERKAAEERRKRQEARQQGDATKVSATGKQPGMGTPGKAVPAERLPDTSRAVEPRRPMVNLTLDGPLGKTAYTETIGGSGGEEFDGCPEKFALLRGVKVRTANYFGNLIIGAVVPLYWTAAGPAEGKECGGGDTPWTTLSAKAGYAVGALVGTGGSRLDGFKLVFMRITPTGLDPNDKYESEWTGGHGGGGEREIGGSGAVVLGIFGRAWVDVDAIGLVLSAPTRVVVPPEPTTLKPEITLNLGGVKMELVLVPAGEFDMGSNDGYNNEAPIHRAKISHPFYIGKYHVTARQFQAFAAATKYRTEAKVTGKVRSVKGMEWEEQDGLNWSSPGFKQEEHHPVVAISWNDAREFCSWATRVAQVGGPGLPNGGQHCIVRLPTETEWEYAARGPNSLRYPWGDRWEVKANVADASLKATGFNPDWGRIRGDDGCPYTSPVGTYKNASWCGAFDMAGNTWQWCQDWWSDKYYGESPPTDPPGPAKGIQRVFRGGSFIHGSNSCRSANRGWASPGSRYADCGFRVALEVGAAETPGRVALPEAPAPKAVIPATAQKGLVLDLGGGVKMDFVLVPPGDFMMGAWDIGDWEGPVHRVRISKPFYMAKYETNVAQFKAFADGARFTTDAEKRGRGNTWQDERWQELPGISWRMPGFPQTDNSPVCVISWFDARDFCKWAAAKTGRAVFLPSEAQWEYACRAGTTTKYNTGDQESNLEEAVWYSGNSGLHTNPCGLKKPNAWGLYDMQGNVIEWVQDWFSEKYFADGPTIDPKGPADGTQHVLRGAAWDLGPRDCRVARRWKSFADDRFSTYGFRCAVECAPAEIPGRTARPEVPAPKPVIPAAPLRQMALDLGGGVKVELVQIPAGSFTMGASDDEAGWESDGRESPPHEVRITKPFFMGKYEVTVAQFGRFAVSARYQTEAEKAGDRGGIWDGGWKDGAGVNWAKPNYAQDDSFPVCLISWTDAQAFVSWATKTTGMNVRLPTEAEWEYGCRAGTTTRFYSGQDNKDLGKAGWYNGNTGNATFPVGKKAPNGWGLYDMHGNLREWCQDIFQKDYYLDSTAADPTGPDSGPGRVLRGGSWTCTFDECRSARRFWRSSDFRGTDTGFRLVVDGAAKTP